jgi:hypothetical protein
MTNEEYRESLQSPRDMDIDQRHRLVDEMETLSGHGHPCVMEEWRRDFIDYCREIGMDVSGIDGSKSRAMGNFTLNGRRRRRRR